MLAASNVILSLGETSPEGICCSTTTKEAGLEGVVTSSSFSMGVSFATEKNKT